MQENFRKFKSPQEQIGEKTVPPFERKVLSQLVLLLEILIHVSNIVQIGSLSAFSAQQSLFQHVSPSQLTLWALAAVRYD